MLRRASSESHPEEVSCQLPWFIRRRLGLVSRGNIPYNQAVRMRFGESTFMLTHPDDIHHVLVSRARDFVKTPNLVSEKGRQRAGSGLLTSAGDRHQLLRRGLQPIFVNSAALPFAASIQAHTEKRLRTWHDQQTLDISQEMTQLGLEILIGMVFGNDFDNLDSRFGQAIVYRRRYNEYVINGRMPFRTRIPTPTVRRYQWAMKIIDKEIYRAIRERRLNQQGASQDFNFISLLSGVNLPDGNQLTDQQVRDEVLTLTTAGYETTSDGLSWTLYLLAKHPEVQDILREEVVANQEWRHPSPTCLKSLPMITAALEESWRLYPPTWIYVRTPIKAATLPSGTKVPANSRLYLCPYVMHRHPDHFSDPERFDPNRFAPDASSPPRSVYFPFGNGPHICIGAPLARLESSLILAAIVARFRIHDDSSHLVKPFAGVTLRPGNGVKVHLESLQDYALTRSTNSKLSEA
ncbi:MAG: cytochrome P450 [Planctomycetaceae bacterium]|nr:cytochrome P450 [Planctomycetaceae bacterium]